MNSTPSHPPKTAPAQRSASIPDRSRERISAGSVKITPEAIDWPALPVVCTILFSRIEALPNARRIEIESTEIGIDAATVSPARSPTYTRHRAKQHPKDRPQQQRPHGELRPRLRGAHKGFKGRAAGRAAARRCCHNRSCSWSIARPSPGAARLCRRVYQRTPRHTPQSTVPKSRATIRAWFQP